MRAVVVALVADGDGELRRVGRKLGVARLDGLICEGFHASFAGNEAFEVSSLVLDDKDLDRGAH